MIDELKSFRQPKNCEMFIHRGVYLPQIEVDRMIDNMLSDFIEAGSTNHVGVSMCGNTLIVAIPPDTEAGETEWAIYDCLPRRYGTYDPTRQNTNKDK